MPKFYTTFALKMNKMPKFYMIIARKYFFQIFFLGGTAKAPLPPSPIS